MSSVILVVVLIASMALPMAIAVGAVLWQKRMQGQEARRSPLVDKLAHLPGEQLRQRMESLSDLIEGRILELLMIGPTAALIVLLPRVDYSALRLSGLQWAIIAFAFAFAFGLTLWNVRKLIPLWRERRQCRQGLLAEVATAQLLDRLQAQGCLVLHDIPAGSFNIDHVVVGPSAVFMVETKSRLKKGEGKGAATVLYDGSALQFPGWAERRPMEQARAQARWLADYLRGETGDPTTVIPVVSLPGWFVTSGKDAHHSDVRVINPKMTSLFVELGRRPPLDPSHRNRIVNALYKRYPELDTD